MKEPIVYRFTGRLAPSGYLGLPVERAGTFRASVPADRPLAEMLDLISEDSLFDPVEGAYCLDPYRMLDEKAPTGSLALAVGTSLLTCGQVVFGLTLDGVGPARSPGERLPAYDGAGFDWELAEEFVAEADADPDEDPDPADAPPVYRVLGAVHFEDRITGRRVDVCPSWRAANGVSLGRLTAAAADKSEGLLKIKDALVLVGTPGLPPAHAFRGSRFKAWAQTEVPDLGVAPGSVAVVGGDPVNAVLVEIHSAPARPTKRSKAVSGVAHFFVLSNGDWWRYQDSLKARPMTTG